jgi:putative transposase
MVTSAMQLYFTGESLRNVQKFLKLQGLEITHVSIYNWIRKYVGLMKSCLQKITPNVADAWRADELYLKVKGNPKYRQNPLMDDQTRFWIAQQVSDNKYTSNIRPLLQNARELANKRPNTFITDGAPFYGKQSKD